MIIQKFSKGPLGNNNYVIIDEISHEAIIIDCTEKPQDMLNYITSQKASLKYILLTHGHFDHILGLNDLNNELLQKSYVDKNDKFLLDDINDFMDFISFPHVIAPKISHFFDEKTNLFLGKIPIKIISTPGHTPGCVCFLIQNNLFSGDTLFYNSRGRTDMPKSSDQEIMKSLKKLFSSLPDKTLVFPGHGPSTSIGKEKLLYQF